MLTLSRLQAKFGKPILNQKNKKHLRISVGNTATHTLQHGKILNPKSIEWEQKLVIPLIVDQQYQFEIYEKHEFGYNEKQFQTILKGTFQIHEYQEKNSTWQIFLNNKQKVGFLSADVDNPHRNRNSPRRMKKSYLRNQSSIMFNTSQVENEESYVSNKFEAAEANNKSYVERSFVQAKSDENKQKIPQNGKVLRVASIVVKTTGKNFKRGFVIIKMGDRSVKTKVIRSRAGELVFIESEEIKYLETDTDADLQVYSADKPDSPELLASGTLQLLVPKPPRSVGLMKDGYQVGEILIDSKIIDKNKAKTNFSNIFKQNNALYEQSVKKKQNRTDQVSQSVNFTKLEDFGISQTSRVHYYGLQSSRSTLSPRKKNSVVNGNRNIPFPKQKRFMLYQDKQNQRVSYLRDRSFDFKSPQSGRYYKGAAFGYGGKSDFSSEKRANPGVGNYRLPSIWDRY